VGGGRKGASSAQEEDGEELVNHYGDVVSVGNGMSRIG